MPDNLFEILRQRHTPFVYGDRRSASMDSFIVLSQRPMPFGGAGGGGYIAGILPGVVTVDGTPAARQLELRLRSHNRRMIATTWSDPNSGTYRFDDLNPQDEYDLIARDHNRVYSDVIIPAIRPWPYLPTLTETLSVLYIDQVDFQARIIGGDPPYSLENLVSIDITVEITDDVLTISGESISDTVSFDIVDSNNNRVSYSTLVSAFSEVPIQNPSAEDGLSGWTVSMGTLDFRVGPPPYFLMVGAECMAHQDIVLPAEYIPLVDSGREINAVLQYLFGGYSGDTDSGRTGLVFLDENDEELGATWTKFITRSSFAEQSLNGIIPAMTRTIRIVMHGQRSSGTNLDAYWTDFKLNLR